MRNGKDSCLFGEELVSYIYDELPTSERHSFEGHLLNCSSCTAEFAELSMSRLGVYEWHRDEFVPLETPRFAIPYAPPAPAYSWMDAIRGFILTPPRLSFAGGALALLVLALGWFYAADSNSSALVGNQGTPSVIEVPVPENTSVVAEALDKVLDDKYITDKVLGENAASEEASPSKSGRRPAIVQAKAVKGSANRQLTARGIRPAKAPRLGTFEEVEDTSLRLADLVADIDSYRK
jgi:hypothetical protein